MGGQAEVSSLSGTRSTNNYLVSPRSDAWLLGGLGIVAWVFFSAPSWGWYSSIGAIEGPLYWFLLALSGTHFGASYHLAYGQGRHHVRQQANLLVTGPLLLVAVSIGVVIIAAVGARERADEILRFLLVGVFTLTTWHYIKQVYGVMRVGASLNQLKLDPLSTKVLRYGLYPLWLVEAGKVWSGRSTATREDIAISYELLPRSAVTTLEWVSWVSMATIAVVFARLLLRWRRLPGTMWTPYVAAFLWLVYTPGVASTVLVFGALHGVQYLACAHRAEVAWGTERSPGSPTIWWASVFGGALATGFLLVYWLPQLLTGSTETTAVGTIPAALLFVGFNLHHYAVDASIWRFGGEHIARITGRHQPVTHQPSPGRSAARTHRG